MGGMWLSRPFVRNFLSHSAEKIVAESFSVSVFLGTEKFFGKERFVKIFCQNFFVSQYRKPSSWNPSVLQIFSCVETFFGSNCGDGG